PSLEEAAEISGASAFATLFSVTFPLIMPAIISGMLLSFVVMLGIYGIPAVLGAPANINVLTTYIFKLTAWSPPLYSTAAAVAIILMGVTGLLVVMQQSVMSGKSFTTVAGKAFRPRSLDLGPWRWLTLAFAIGYTIHRSQAVGRRGIDVISSLPVAIPGLVIGVAYLWAWIGLPGGLYGTIWILALAFVARFIPDTTKALSTSLMQIHR